MRGRAVRAAAVPGSCEPARCAPRTATARRSRAPAHSEGAPGESRPEQPAQWATPRSTAGTCGRKRRSAQSPTSESHSPRHSAPASAPRLAAARHELPVSAPAYLQLRAKTSSRRVRVADRRPGGASPKPQSLPTAGPDGSRLSGSAPWAARNMRSARAQSSNVSMSCTRWRGSRMASECRANRG